MKTASAKAKGRRLQNWVVEQIRSALRLHPDDVRPALMSEGGEDIKLSVEGRRLFPYSVECKNQEAFNVWAALKQARANAKDGAEPLVFFTRNRENAVYVALSADHFLGLLGELRDLEDEVGIVTRIARW